MILHALVLKLKRQARGDFRGRHFEATLIVQVVSWYLRYALSYRDIEEMLLERGLEVDHSTINRWVLAYAPAIERRLRMFRKPHCGSVRVDETYIKIRGQWRYLYRAIDKHGEAVDFLLTANRDLDAAKRFFRKMLREEPLLAPDRIGTDGAGPYPPALAESRQDGLLPRTPTHHVTKHLQQGIESDHFRVKRPMPRVGGFPPSPRPGGRSRASRPCCGCARASGLRGPGPCGSRTSCWRTASDFPSRTKRESGAEQALLRPEPEFATSPHRARDQACGSSCPSAASRAASACRSAMNSSTTDPRPWRKGAASARTRLRA
ncbi:Transposase and inactivated derivatives-like protein (plasmid) [Methylobacterium nodulans ORS 2060]|uniref:Transposase and inactivated derivatives-like protein n=1 Tax=Methylobacterium nodulans (strain LMG 21967 / CNCM I-2342 / ORS 2060) TaxID=460265 RepID=B8IWB5_METNO|nr:Transposase and inactivated derivatives-like protein [Methylobacterium nodulans ORS 2060]